MELKQIRHFLAVAEAGSLGRAAQSLSISQPALSKSIHRLEEGLKAPLFHRTPRGTSLTRFGLSFLDHARVMDLEARSAHAELSAMLGGRRGDVTLGISPSMARYIVPIAAARIFGAPGQCRLNIITGMVDDLIRRVHSGALDVAICPLPANFSDSEVEYRHLADEEMTVVAGGTHPLRRRRALQLQDLQAYDWILPSGAGSGRSALVRAFLNAGYEPPRSMVDTDSISFVYAFLGTTQFLSFLPRALLDVDRNARSLTVLRVAGQQWKRNLTAVYLKRAALPPVCLRLIAEIHTVLVEQRGKAGRRSR